MKKGKDIFGFLFSMIVFFGGLSIYFTFIYDDPNSLNYEDIIPQKEQKEQELFEKKLDSALFYSCQEKLQSFAKIWEENKISISDTTSKTYILNNVVKNNMSYDENLRGIFIESSSLKQINKKSYVRIQKMEDLSLHVFTSDFDFKNHAFLKKNAFYNRFMESVEKANDCPYFFVLDDVLYEDIVLYDYRKVSIVDVYTNQIIKTLEVQYRPKSTKYFNRNVIKAIQEDK